MHQNVTTPFSQKNFVSRNQIWFDLFINKSRILHNPNTVFLGITFSEFPNFRAHAEGLTIRARKRVNIIKICIHKSWNLTHVTLKRIKMP